jgi:hypothetical protein
MRQPTLHHEHPELFNVTDKDGGRLRKLHDNGKREALVIASLHLPRASLPASEFVAGKAQPEERAT